MTKHKIDIKQLFHILSSPKRIGLMLISASDGLGSY